MKRTRMILTLAAILALAVLCSVGALASADDVIYQLYPTPNGDAQVETRYYCADFNRDIVITFADLQQKYGKLELARFTLKDNKNNKEDVFASWKDYDWEFGKAFGVYSNDKGEVDQSFFVRKDASEAADSIDDSFEVSYCIRGFALKKFEYLSLVFYVGDDPNEMKPIWKGDIYGTVSSGDTVNIEKLTLNRAYDGSAVQNADAAPETAAADAAQDAAAAEEPILPVEPAAPGKDEEQENQAAAADAEQDGQTTAADAEQENQTAAADAEQENQAAAADAEQDSQAKAANAEKGRPETASDAEPENQAIALDKARKDQPPVKDEEITEAAEPLSLLLCGETGDPVELATEDDEGRLQAAGAETIKLIPGEYSFVLEGGMSDEKLRCTLSDPNNPKYQSAFPVETDNKNKCVQIEAAQSYGLTVNRGDEEKIELNLVGLITKGITIDEPRFENGMQEARFDFVNSNGQDVCINIDQLNNGDRLVFTGTAEAGIPLAWELTKGESVVRSGAVSCDESDAWSVSVGLDMNAAHEKLEGAIIPSDGENAFMNYEGELEFSICYDLGEESEKYYAGTEETSECGKASCAVKIDTKAPEGYIEFAYGEEVLEPKDGSPAIFAEKDDCRLEVRYGEVVNGERAEQVNVWTPGADDVSDLSVVDLDGQTSITYTLSDEAGNQAQVTASVRIVQPIQLSGQTIDGAALETGEWIGATQREAKIVGTAEPGEEIVGTLSISDQTGGPAATEQTVTEQTVCAENGEWQLEYALPAELPEEGELKVEIRYQDEALQVALGSVASQTWNFDFQAPEAPQMTIGSIETDDGEIPTFVAGQKLSLYAVPQEDGATLASLTMSLNGGDAEDIIDEVQDGSYSFDVQSGQYVFAATAQDPAGNVSDAAELVIDAVDRMRISENVQKDGILNDADLKDGGLVFDIQADAKGGDVDFECLLDGEAKKGLGILKGEKGSWQLSIAYEDLKNCNLNGDAPVSLELNVFYTGLDHQSFGDSWEGRIDLWPPVVKIGAMATHGRNDGKYFGGERILVKVLTKDDTQPVVKSDPGVIEEIDEAAFKASVDGGSMVKTYVTNEDGLTGKYYALDSKDFSSLKISASVEDEAGNSAEDVQALGRYDKTQQIKDNVTISGVITRREDARVTVEGQGAIPMYRLTIVDSASGTEIQQIEVGANGKWTLELSEGDLPKDFAGDVWELTAKYPGEYYNEKVNPCTFAVPVDLSCKLEWEEPKEGDASIAVQTEPGAEVTLLLDGSEIGKISADRDGAAVFELERRITRNSRVAVHAVDENGNESEISNANGVTEAAEHMSLEIAEIQQKDAHTVIASGTGEPGLTVEARIDGSDKKSSETVNKEGKFTIELEVDENATRVHLVLNYKDIYADEKAESDFDMDRTGPMLSISPEVVSDVGGEVTVRTEAGAEVYFTDKDTRDAVYHETAKAEEVTMKLPMLNELTEIEAYAVDEYGNKSASVYLTVEASPHVMAGFDQPTDQAVLDSEGRVLLSGWIAASDEGASNELVLSIAQGDVRKELKLGGAAVTLKKDDARLKEDADLQALSGQMNVRHCWSFAYELALGEWEKGEFEVRLIHNQETLSARSFSSGVDAGRRLRYIVFCALALAACLIFLVLALCLSKRIKRLSDGRINPNSGMSKLTERSRQQPKQ